MLKDLIASKKVPCFRLTQVFRQARESLIIKYAHMINKGQMPWIQSPFKHPGVWQDGTDCLFIDSDEATQEQLTFISRVKRIYGEVKDTPEDSQGPQEGAKSGNRIRSTSFGSARRSTLMNRRSPFPKNSPMWILKRWQRPRAGFRNLKPS